MEYHLNNQDLIFIIETEYKPIKEALSSKNVKTDAKIPRKPDTRFKFLLVYSNWHQMLEYCNKRAIAYRNVFLFTIFA